MRTRLLPFDSLTEAHLDAWRELASAAVEPNPFFEPSFVVPAERYLPHGKVDLLVVDDGSGSDWRAVLPVEHRRRPAPHLRAWVHEHAHSSTPLVHADGLTATVDALLDALVRPRTLLWTALNQLRADGPIGHALSSRVVERDITPLWVSRAERAALLPRTGQETETVSLLSGKQRSELRRKMRRLGETLDAEPTVEDRAGSDDAVHRLVSLEHHSWKGTEGTSLLSTLTGSEFFIEVCRNFAAEGRLILLELRAGERSFALTAALRAGNGVFGYKVADDREHGRFSPGMQVQVALGETVLAEGPHTWIDSCSDPDNETQNRLWPHRRRVAQLLLPTRSPLTALAGSAVRRALGEEQQRPEQAPSRSKAPVPARG